MAGKDGAPMTPCQFVWQPDTHKRYEVDGKTCTFVAGGTEYNRPVVSATAFAPNTGKHYFEMLFNGDNMRVGVATEDADLNAEMGKGNGLYSLDLQTGSCCINGVEKKKLWRLIVSVTGGRFGFCWDSDAGVLQVWYNGDFAGTCLHKDFGLAGKTVRPIVGIAGVEANNRDIGTGKKSVVVVEPTIIPKPVLSH